MKVEATVDNTSIRVSWEWSCQRVLDLVRVDYQPEGGSLMMYTVGNTTETSVNLSSLQCNTKYTVWVQARGGGTGRRSSSKMVSLPARGMYILYLYWYSFIVVCNDFPAPPTPTNVTGEVMNASSVRVAWQWSSSGPAPNCFNTTHVTYHPEGGGESSLQLSDPAANETTLTDLQCNTNYIITVVATAGEHRRESLAITVHLPQQGIATD